jgi:hypothetical protein
VLAESTYYPTAIGETAQRMDDQQIQDETRTRVHLIQDAWAAAREAAHEDDAELSDHSRLVGWRNMWIALAIAGTVLLLAKLIIFP